MNATLSGILVYILFQLGLGFYVSRRINTEDDYLLAGRSLGFGLTTFSIFATWFGAESCIGAAGAAYREGLSGVIADPFGYGLAILFLGLLFAAPLWKKKLTTIADFFRDRYSPRTERAVAIIMIPTSLLWAAAQIRAFGQVLSASSELELSIAVTLAAAVVIAYTVMGGMLADAITDVVQGGVLIVGLFILGYAIMDDTGGLSGIVDRIADNGLFRPAGEHTGGFSALLTAEAWAIPIFGSVIAQEVVSRTLAARSHVIARRSALTAGAMYLLIGLFPLTIGLLGHAMMPGLEDGEMILPLMAQQHLPTALYVVFAGALVSAILSTVDSTLLASSALLSHNVLMTARRTTDESKKVRMERWAVVGLGMAAYVLAIYAEGVYDLVKDASSFGSAGIFIAFVLGMYAKTGGEKSALAALASGAVLWIVGHYIVGFELSYLLSLFGSLLAFLIFSRSGIGNSAASS